MLVMDLQIVPISFKIFSNLYSAYILKCKKIEAETWYFQN